MSMLCHFQENIVVPRIIHNYIFQMSVNFEDSYDSLVGSVQSRLSAYQRKLKEAQEEIAEKDELIAVSLRPYLAGFWSLVGKEKESKDSAYSRLYK